MRCVKWIRVAVACAALAVWIFPVAGCKSQETKKTTIKVEGPNSERKITVEKRVTKDRDHD